MECPKVSLSSATDPTAFELTDGGKVQPQGTQRLFFLLHGDPTGGGFDCRGITELLGPDQLLYAVPPSTPRRAGDILTIDGMAAAHIAALRTVQPRGPYRLGGYSLGGLVAFEMAHQLRRAGEAVEMLLLVDSRAPAARQKWQWLRPQEQAYTPAWYDGRIDLVQALPTGRVPPDATLGWGRLAREVVPQFPQTSHLSLAVTHLPAILREALRRVSAEGTGRR